MLVLLSVCLISRFVNQRDNLILVRESLGVLFCTPQGCTLKEKLKGAQSSEPVTLRVPIKKMISKLPKSKSKAL